MKLTRRRPVTTELRRPGRFEPANCEASSGKSTVVEALAMIYPRRGFETPHEESYSAIESPNGELGFYLVGDGTHVAYRARCRPPSYIHFAIFPYLIAGHQISDVVAVLGSLNIIAAELDR